MSTKEERFQKFKELILAYVENEKPDSYVTKEYLEDCKDTNCTYTLANMIESLLYEGKIDDDYEYNGNKFQFMKIGEYNDAIFNVNNGEYYFYLESNYDSWNDSDPDLKEVKPVEKLITVWEDV